MCEKMSSVREAMPVSVDHDTFFGWALGEGGGWSLSSMSIVSSSSSSIRGRKELWKDEFIVVGDSCRIICCDKAFLVNLICLG